MKFFLSIIGRLIVIGFALIAAFFSASVFIIFNIVYGFPVQMAGSTSHVEHGHFYIDLMENFLFAVFFMIALAIFAILPVFIAIAVSELMRWNDLTIHFILGSLCALFTMFSVFGLDNEMIPENGDFLVVVLATGFIATFIYWLIAGRNAGKWLDPIQPGHDTVKDALSTLKKQDADRKD